MVFEEVETGAKGARALTTRAYSLACPRVRLQ